MANPTILYDSRFDDATPVASTTAAGFDVLNLRDWRSYTQWKPTALPAMVTVDSGSATAADYAAIWGHDLNTQGATVEIRGSIDNFAASDVELASSTPGDDEPFALHFSSVAYRYWRLKITGSTMPTLAIAAIGAKLDIPAGIREGFDPTKREPKGIQNRSVTGNALGSSVKFEEWRETLTFELLAWSWIRSTWIPAWEAHLRGTPFVFQWDRTGHPAELFLVAREGGFDTPHKAGSYTPLSLTVVGLA